MSTPCIADLEIAVQYAQWEEGQKDFRRACSALYAVYMWVLRAQQPHATH